MSDKPWFVDKDTSPANVLSTRHAKAFLVYGAKELRDLLNSYEERIDQLQSQNKVLVEALEKIAKASQSKKLGYHNDSYLSQDECVKIAKAALEKVDG